MAGGQPRRSSEPPDIAFDGVEAADPRQRLDGDRGRVRGLDVEEVSPRVRPAESQRNRVALGQRFVGAVAIDLEASSEAGQMRGGTLVLAVGLVDIGDARRLGTAPGPVVAGIGPQLAGLGLASARIEHRRARLVGEELVRTLQDVEQSLVDGP